jgi:hypothetical protein
MKDQSLKEIPNIAIRLTEEQTVTVCGNLSSIQHIEREGASMYKGQMGRNVFIQTDCYKQLVPFVCG